MTDILPLSAYQKKRVIQALEETLGQNTPLHRIFNLTDLKFKKGVFADGWLWFKKSKKNETEEEHLERYALFRRVVHYTIYLTQLHWWDYYDVLVTHDVRFGATFKRGFVNAAAA